MRTYKPHARVAGRTSPRIDGVDGVPTTHTQRGWHHAWTVTDGPNGAAPCPFAAKKGVPATVAVPAMCALVLIAMTLALVSVLDGHPKTVTIVVASYGLLLLWSVVLLVPAIVRSRR